MSKVFVKLTRLNLQRLAPSKKLMEHGIVFERLPDGDGFYSVNVMIDGHRIHRVVGKESDGTTRTQAEEFLLKVKSDAKNNRLNLPKGRKSELLFEDAADKYLSRLDKSGGKDLEKKAARLKHHLIPFFGQIGLSKITAFTIDCYKSKRLKDLGRKDGETPKPATINRELAVLSHLLNCAVEWGWIKACRIRIKRLNEGDGRIVYLTKEQCDRLLECAKHDSSYHVFLFIEIALGTAMRRMEILRMRWEDVDYEKQIIHIPKAKAGAREQPMTAHDANILKQYKESVSGQSPWVFSSTNSSTGHVVNIEKAFRRVVLAAGLDPTQVTRHTLRHTVITHLVQGGVDLPTVKRISGHKTLAMVERYSHQNGEHIHEAMDKLECRLKVSNENP